MKLNKDRHARVMRMLIRAASYGLPCPTNDDIAAAVGCKSGSASKSMMYLERQGLISVMRGDNARDVTILATGRKTKRTVAKARADGRSAKQGEALPSPCANSDWRMLDNVARDMAGARFIDHPKGDSDRFPAIRLSRPARYSAGVVDYSGAA